MEIDDYSTSTGLLVMISSTATSTSVHLTGEEWQQLLIEIKAGLYDHFAQAPHDPFMHWPEKQNVES